MRVEFVEPGGPVTFQSWPDADGVPAVGETADLWPTGATGPDDQIPAKVIRRQWYDLGKTVLCYVTTR